ncbi:uncharacterized protein LODBEIA_P37530 [Lodderomyces beijingensis]|uniref:RecA family profile 1 domain-containing protein n=1 Tax=Lodderomyces beijingensis TaxID=1775926 RepID=A0ABP0ZNQ6_9ASCO
MDDCKQLGSNDFTSSQNFPFLVSLLQSQGKFIADIIPSTGDSQELAQNLSRLLSRPTREIEEYFKCLNDDLSVSPSNIDELFDDGGGCISTGLPEVDRDLGGGIAAGEVTEVFGASGCGKSQFLYQILHNCMLRFPQSKPILVATESFMESKRLESIFKSDKSESVTTKLDRTSYIYCPDLESQDHILFTQLPIHLSQNQGETRLLVIDSIAQHFRREDAVSHATAFKKKLHAQAELLAEDPEFTNNILPKQRNQMKSMSSKSAKYAMRSAKASYLCQIYRHLIRLARQFKIAIVVVNQVSAHTMDYDNGKGEWDNVIEEDLLYPLNLDFQTLVSSGWDPKVVSKHLPTSSVQVNERDLELLDLELAETEKNSDPVEQARKRQRTNAGGHAVDDPRYNRVNLVDLVASQRDLILKAHDLRNKNTKKLVPTMGYTWSSRIQNRIMLMKTYKPVLKSEDEIRKEIADSSDDDNNITTDSVSVDPETGLTFASLCQGFNRSKKQQNADHKNTEPPSGQNQTRLSIVKGWQVERFAKVVLSSTVVKTGRICGFKIEDDGLRPA